MWPVHVLDRLRSTMSKGLSRVNVFSGFDVWLFKRNVTPHVNNVLNSVITHVLTLMVMTNEWSENSKFIRWIHAHLFLLLSTLCTEQVFLICIKAFREKDNLVWSYSMWLKSQQRHFKKNLKHTDEV